MDPETLFKLWAPESSPWSAWAKPSLFATADDVQDQTGTVAADLPPLPWLPSKGAGVAMVAVLCGARAVSFGVQAALRGYQPVPLFNTTAGADAAVPVGPILAALRSGATALPAHVDRNAPPAFLIDALRLNPPRQRQDYGAYDNRWIVFPADFPSAARMRERGIRSVLVVRERDYKRGRDLDAVLAGWGREGLEIQEKVGLGEGQAVSARVERSLLSPFLSWWLRLQRRDTGTFGAWVPPLRRERTRIHWG